MVRNTFRSWLSELSSPKMAGPWYIRSKLIAIWNVAWPRIMRVIRQLINPECLQSGFRFTSSSDKGSVANAKAANVSIIMLTHSNCTALRMLSDVSDAVALTKDNTTAAILTVNWKVKNLRTPSLTARPHFNAWRIELKLSSIRIISDASLATSVPVTPIANPTFANFRAGPSLQPSPTIATTSSSCCNRVTTSVFWDTRTHMRCLCQAMLL